MIPPRTDLDDEDTRLLTYQRAHSASIEHLDAVTSVAADIGATTAGPHALSAIDRTSSDDVLLAADRSGDELADELSYRAALAALSGVVQRSLRDFLS